MAEQPTILIAVSGGVAAYKAAHVASRLTQAGMTVQVAMTPAAQKLVAPITFAAVTNRPPLTEIFVDPVGETSQAYYPHLYPATLADAFVLVPATANTIAGIAHGFADNVVTAAALALPAACRRFFCPAMNPNMWQQTTVQDNCRRLETLDWQAIGPEEGRMACGTAGAGRLADPDRIVDAVLSGLRDGPLTDRTILICSGPTREPIDPVRFISNHSSGRMGQALAIAARNAGATVEFVTGPVAPQHLPAGPRIRIHRVGPATQMLAAAQSLFPHADAALFTAAVADFAPDAASPQKLPKQQNGFTIRLEPTPDIAAALGAAKAAGQVCIGFALETHDGLAKARRKRDAKHLDAIVLNGTDSLDSPTGTFQFFAADANDPEPWGTIDKTECARRIVSRLAAMLPKRGA